MSPLARKFLLGIFMGRRSRATTFLLSSDASTRSFSVDSYCWTDSSARFTSNFVLTYSYKSASTFGTLRSRQKLPTIISANAPSTKP